MSNAAGSADSSAPLTIIQPIRFVQPLSDKTVKAGETTALEAETDRPPKVIKWYKNGEEIGPGKTGPGNKFSLEIPNAGKDDEAKYTVRNKAKNPKKQILLRSLFRMRMDKQRTQVVPLLLYCQDQLRLHVLYVR